MRLMRNPYACCERGGQISRPESPPVVKAMDKLYSEIVVAGCGNPLYADDGFGPAVVEKLKALELPENISVVDAGLGGPHFIFTLLSPESTKALIIIDIADFGGEPG